MTYTDTEIYNGDSTPITIRMFIKWVDITRKNAKGIIAHNAMKKI